MVLTLILPGFWGRLESQGCVGTMPVGDQSLQQEGQVKAMGSRVTGPYPTDHCLHQLPRPTG